MTEIVRSYPTRGITPYLEIDRSKHHPTPLVGIITEINDTHVAPCLAAGKPVTSLFDLIEDWDYVADSLAPGEPSENIDDIEILYVLPMWVKGYP